MAAQSELEAAFEQQLRAEGIAYEREVCFHPTRKWRFDFIFPESRKLAVEVDGGTFSGGRHTRGVGYQGDCDKFNQATLLGWAVIHVTSKMLDDLTGLALVKEMLKREAE